MALGGQDSYRLNPGQMNQMISNQIPAVKLIDQTSVVSKVIMDKYTQSVDSTTTSPAQIQAIASSINGMVNTNIMVHTAVEETPGQGVECPVTGVIPDTRSYSLQRKKMSDFQVNTNNISNFIYPNSSFIHDFHNNNLFTNSNLSLENHCQSSYHISNNFQNSKTTNSNNHSPGRTIFEQNKCVN